MKNCYNIVLTGVGGQGTVLASRLLAHAAMKKGLPVKSAETIGMAQKGGAVFSHLRIGEAPSPGIRKGTADILIAFEPAEGARQLPFLAPEGTVVVNTRPILPVTAALAGTDYTGREMIEYLRAHTAPGRLFPVDGTALAEEAGSAKALNVVLLGAALRSGALDFLRQEDLEEAIRARVKPAFVEMNLKALLLA